MAGQVIREPEEADFERWVEAFRGPLVGLLASWGPDWRAAEELAQDTSAEAWLGRARFRGDLADRGAVGAWLRGIAFHLHAAARRTAGRRRAQPLDPEQAAEEDKAPDERRVLFAAAFAELNAAHQTVLRMHCLEETSTREVAALLGLSPKAVEGRLYQAPRALRAMVERVARRSAQEVRA
ncbi:MAG: sigma-70 family RNA polymerase sigma factor [Planctomycetota bacterium]